MRKFGWQLLIALGGLVLIVGLLLRQSVDPQNTDPQPVRGGSYSEALVGNIVRLNPVLDGFNQVDRDIDRLLYRGLIKFDSRGLPQPDLAERWAVSADGKLYNVQLKEDITWHDGEPLSSDDVIYTFSKFQEPDFPGPDSLSDFWQQIEMVRLDEFNVQFQLPEPYSPFLDHLSAGLLPEHVLRGVSITELIDHPFNLEPIGTGPYQFAGFIFDEDDQIVGVNLNAYANYQPQPAFIDQISFRLYANDQAALAAYQEGDVQGIGQVGSTILGPVLESSELDIYSSRVPRVTLVFFNTQHPEKTFFSEPLLRNALALATDRRWIINRFLGAQAVVATGPVLPGTWAFAEGLDPIAYDPEQAARDLEALGWELPTGATQGSPEYVRTLEESSLTFSLAYPDDGLHEDLAQALVDQWAQIGVAVVLEPTDPESLLEDYLEAREFEAVLTDLDLSRFPDPDPYPFWHDSQVETGQNYSGFNDRNTGIWLEQARITTDLSRRARLYRDFQFRFQDQSPAVMLFHPIYTYAISNTIQGVSLGPIFDPSDRFAQVHNWFLLARRGIEAPPTEPAATP